MENRMENGIENRMENRMENKRGRTIEFRAPGGGEVRLLPPWLLLLQVFLLPFPAYATPSLCASRLVKALTASTLLHGTQ